MRWIIKHIFNFSVEKTWENGYAQFGFHDNSGNFYVLHNEQSWFGQYTKNNEFLWTAGSLNPKLSENHISFDLRGPMYVARVPTDESLIITSGGNKRIFKIFPYDKKTEVFIDADKYNLQNIGNCVPDREGNVWINEITGCKIWQFDSNGNKKLILGDGKPGFQKEDTSFNKVRFNWIYDIRMGVDENLFVLDSKNYALRMIDTEENKVKLIAGKGSAGYDCDGGPAFNASFGSNQNEQFDGPWALSLDEVGNIFIGDTHNHVVRMINKKTNIISTILGNPNHFPSKRNFKEEKDRSRINLPKICSMDYYDKELFIPEWDGDLIVLEKISSEKR
jgi:hypothetical protein